MVDDASACTSIVHLRSIYTCTRVRLPCMHGMRMPRVRKRALLRSSDETNLYIILVSFLDSFFFDEDE
jgi:hypothetical protein